MNQPVKLYHNPGCSKSCTAKNVLEEISIPFEQIDYLVNAPDVAELEMIVAKLNCKPLDLIRKTEPIFITQFAGKELSDKEWLTALNQYPILIQRPIIISGDQVIIARSEETLQQLFDL